MITFKKWAVILLAALFMTGIIGCGEDDSFEKAGKKADRAVEDAKKSIKKLMD
jgi:hypothetical protein